MATTSSRQIDTRNTYPYYCTAYNVTSIRQQLAAEGYTKSSFTSNVLPNVDGAGITNAILGTIVQPIHMVPRCRLRLEPIAIQRSLSIRALTYLNNSDTVNVSFKNEMLSEHWLHSIVNWGQNENEQLFSLIPKDVTDWSHAEQMKKHTIEPLLSNNNSRRLAKIKESNKMEQLKRTIADEWENNIYIDGSYTQWYKLERKCDKIISDIPKEQHWKPIRTLFQQSRQFCTAVRKYMSPHDEKQFHDLKPLIQKAYVAILPPDTIFGWVGTFDVDMDADRNICSFHTIKTPVFNEALLLTYEEGGSKKKMILEHVFTFNASLNGYLSTIVRSEFQENFSFPPEPKYYKHLKQDKKKDSKEEEKGQMKKDQGEEVKSDHVGQDREEENEKEENEETEEKEEKEEKEVEEEKEKKEEEEKNVPENWDDGLDDDEGSEKKKGG